MNGETQSAGDDGFLRPEELRELRETLFDQGREALDALHAELLALEGQAPGPERLRPLKRAAHTLKSDCASVGFGELSRLSHALEDAFNALEGGAAVSPVQSDVLLLAVDALRSGLEAGARGGAAPEIAPVLARLAGLAATAPASPLSPETRARLEAGRAAGRAALALRVAFAPEARRRERRLAAVLRALEAEPVERTPAGGLERAPLVEVCVLSALSPAVASARAAQVRGARVDVAELLPETRLAPPGGAAPAGARADDALREGETLRVEARRLDDVLNLVGEMVSARATLASVAADIEPRLPQELALRLSEAQSLLARVLQDLQRSAMRLRMVPAERVFRRFTRVVRDLARRSGKRLRLRVEGQTTELDRGVLDALEEPLLHLVRNAVDHGLEAPAERRAAGKPEEGTLALRASREGNQVVIEVSDDGRGIDGQAVLRAALARGLEPAEAEVLSDEERLQLVFRPGLSTARVVSETSGRGVGLDVARATVEALRGSIRATNLPAGGAAFVIRVPLTVAILQALLFRVGAHTLAVPLTSVLEIARTSDLPIERAGGRSLFQWRDTALGLLELADLLGEPAAAPGSGFVLLLRGATGPFGAHVDALLGEQELVIKAVHDRFIRTPLVAGAAVLGGGVAVLILDVLAVQRAARAQQEARRD